MMHLAAAQETAEEMSDYISSLPPAQLAWLVLKSPLGRGPEWSPESVLVAEMLRRIWPECEGYQLSCRGWVKPDGSLEDYR